jgi:hypothetical protein
LGPSFVVSVTTLPTRGAGFQGVARGAHLCQGEARRLRRLLVADLAVEVVARLGDRVGVLAPGHLVREARDAVEDLVADLLGLLALQRLLDLVGVLLREFAGLAREVGSLLAQIIDAHVRLLRIAADRFGALPPLSRFPPLAGSGSRRRTGSRGQRPCTPLESGPRRAQTGIICCCAARATLDREEAP